MSDYIATPADGVCWITGASSGIGFELSKTLAARGWTIYGTARSAEDLAALEAACAGLKGRVIAKPGDVTDRDALSRIVEEIEADRPIALAILNAGVYLPMTADAFDPTAFDKSFAVNLGGTVNGLAPLVPRMMARRSGHLVIVSSVAGYGGLPTSAPYGATKAGLTNLASSLKFDLDRAGVRISVVNPGFVDTPATRKNPFPMPFLMDVDKAAVRFADRLEKPGFEITFPRRFTYLLKIINLLPYWAYFPLVAGGTGWNKRPLEGPAADTPAPKAD